MHCMQGCIQEYFFGADDQISNKGKIIFRILLSSSASCFGPDPEKIPEPLTPHSVYIPGVHNRHGQSSALPIPQMIAPL